MNENVLLDGLVGQEPQDSIWRPDVLLLRDMPGESRSMDRYADDLERALRFHRRFNVRSTAVEHSAAARLGLQRIDGYIARLLRYPLKASRQHADLFHIIDHSYAHLAALLPKERAIVTCHDLMLLLGEEGVAGLRGRRSTVARFRWTTSYLRRVAHVVCVSNSTAADVTRLCGVSPERITVIPNGVDPRFRPLPDETRRTLKAHLPEAGAYAVLHVAGQAAYKNIAETLRVIAALRNSSVDVILLRIGPPLVQGERELAEKLGLESAVVECGFVTDERLVEFYNACDALLFPSLYEGFGWPALEAMACGTPVVSSNRGALAETVGDAGLMADPDDTAALARAVRSVLESSDLRCELTRRGIRRAAEFTWGRAIEQYAGVYGDVLSRTTHRKAASWRRAPAAEE